MIANSVVVRFLVNESLVRELRENAIGPVNDQLDISLIADKVGPLPPPPPRGAGEIQGLLRRTYETISVGGARVPEAADRFVAEAARTLERAG